MAHAHSFTITLSNNKTEKAGLAYLLAKEPEFHVPDAPSRKLILDELGLPHTFSRAFDLVHIKGRPRPPAPVPLAVDKADLTLIELKTTRKLLPQNPRGFFFGATANELDLAQRLGERFRFCFVCLHPDAPSHALLTYAQLEPLIKVKRAQYQINLR